MIKAKSVEIIPAFLPALASRVITGPQLVSQKKKKPNQIKLLIICLPLG